MERTKQTSSPKVTNSQHNVARRATSLLGRFKPAIIATAFFAVGSCFLSQNDAVAQYIDLEANVTEVEPITISNYSHINTDNGLCSNTANLTYKDEAGLVWIGTDDGLNSYDGYIIRSFKPDPDDSTSIPGKQILGICEPTSLTMTIALGDGGVCTYDKLDGTFRKSKQQMGLEADEDNLAFGTIRLADDVYTVFQECIIKLNRITGRIRRLAHDHVHEVTRLGTKKMIAMPGNDGIIVIRSSTQSICILDSRNENITEEKLNDLVLYDIAPIDENRLLLGTRNGLHVYDFRSQETKQLQFLKGELIHALTRSIDGTIWVSFGGNKLLRWNPILRTFARISNCDQIINQNTRINDLREDENGLLWVATNNMGVVKLDTKKPKIRSLFPDINLPADHATYEIAAAPDGTLWCACGTNGIVHIDPKTQKASTIPIPNEDAVSIHPRKDGTVMVGTTKRLIRLTCSTGLIESLNIRDTAADSAGQVMVNQIDEDCLGNLWLSTHIGLYRYNGIDFELQKTPSGERQTFNCVLEDRDGRIWTGSRTGAMLRDIGSTTFRSIKSSRSNRYEEGVFCIVEHENNILMGTSNGVIVFDKRTGRETKSKLFDAFKDKVIYSIASDENGILWLNTSTGIGYVDSNYENIYTFGNADGLRNECDGSPRLTFSNGCLYFGQATAINYIDTRHITFNTRIPHTFVSQAIYSPVGSEEKMKMINDSTFSHKYHPNATTRLQVASSDFTFPARNRFIYKVDDGNWTELTTNNQIFLPSLFPGTYHVRLRCSNADKTWSHEVKSIYINIEPPLWMTRPALIFYSIWIMSMIWLAVTMRFRKINRRMKLAEAEGKAKSAIEEQRNQLAGVISEQRASLNYAKRIQDALMPKAQSFERFFAKLFILYRPKDIVSGDFYTFYNRDGMTFIISADCTGHGVPGAFISILGIDHLNSIIMQQKIDDAGQILTLLQYELRKAIAQIGTEEVNDGMDMTVCVIHHDEKRVNFAGAMNDMYIIRNNEVLTFHGERMSIGTDLSVDNSRPETTFSSQDIECQTGDMMFLFSDGYCDQFGGPEHKKFKVRRFKNLLLNIHKLPANDQMLLLNQKLIEWMGGGDQTDDISIIGFQPWN